MRAKQARSIFETTLPKPFSSLNAQESFEAMVAFYRNTRATDCPLERGNDMLLVQWGIYKWRKEDPEKFDLNITRQLIPPPEDPEEQDEGDVIMQLSLTCYFLPSDELRALGAGNRWCHSLDELEQFEQFLRELPALALIHDRQGEVRLTYNNVE